MPYISPPGKAEAELVGAELPNYSSDQTVGQSKGFSHIPPPAPAEGARPNYQVRRNGDAPHKPQPQ